MQKVAVVTGVTGKFGRGIASGLAQRGYQVVGTGRRAERGPGFESEIRDDGGDATFVASDVSKVADCARIIAATIERYGRIDLLVNNAATVGAPPFTSSHEVDEATWDSILDTNLKGAFYCAVSALPRMMEQRSGNIINIASAMALNIGPPKMAAYSASKAGLITLTRSMAVEYAHYGIRMNAVILGGAEGDSGYQVMDQKLKENGDDRFAGVPYENRDLGRMKGVDMAHTVAYLASDEARHINGAALAVDSGITAGSLYAPLPVSATIVN